MHVYSYWYRFIYAYTYAVLSFPSGFCVSDLGSFLAVQAVLGLQELHHLQTILKRSWGFCKWGYPQYLDGF